MDAIQLNISGLTCDNKSCDYEDQSIKVEDYPQWVNKPCPKCGENLLTEADFQNVQFMLQVMRMGNQMFPSISPDDGKVKMEVKMNGTGEMDFKIKE